MYLSTKEVKENLWIDAVLVFFFNALTKTNKTNTYKTMCFYNQLSVN